MTINYIGGPLDGSIETRPTAPRNGERVHRLVGNTYVTYVFSNARFVYAG
jgi:hypothetical protein